MRYLAIMILAMLVYVSPVRAEGYSRTLRSPAVFNVPAGCADCVQSAPLVVPTITRQRTIIQQAPIVTETQRTIIERTVVQPPPIIQEEIIQQSAYVPQANVSVASSYGVVRQRAVASYGARVAFSAPVVRSCVPVRSFSYGSVGFAGGVGANVQVGRVGVQAGVGQSIEVRRGGVRGLLFGTRVRVR